MSNILKIGTRGSELALKQANIVKNLLLSKFLDLKIEIIIIKTKGDKILNKSINKIGGKGVFVKEIEEALIDKEIDIAVHSLKDMPYDMPDSLKIGAFTERESPIDIFISHQNKSFFDMPIGSKIGTGSLRRSIQLKRLRNDIEIVPIRGNINTRISKIGNEVDGVVLAEAGINRLELSELISYKFNIDEMVPAVCQGIIAVQIRKNDKIAENYVSKINDNESYICQKAERSFLKNIGADCNSPAGAYAYINENNIVIKGVYYTNRVVFDEIFGDIRDAEFLGEILANNIMKK